MNRVVTAHSALGPTLLFKQLLGKESLSTVFDFEVELLSENASIEASELLGQSFSLEIKVDELQTRYLNGDVISFSYIGQELGGRRLARYRAQVRPWLWYLSRNRDCKIYQNMTVVDILDEVLGSYPGYSYSKRLSASYSPYEFCVQYEESDLDFVQRLMEQEGIYYYFEHHLDRHELILCDDISAHDMLPQQPSIPYYPHDANTLVTEQSIHSWMSHQQLQGVEYVVDDYDFKKSSASLRQQRRVPYSIEQANREIYDWQAGYADPDKGEHYVRIRVEEAHSASSRIEGQANARAMAPGYVFNLRKSPRLTDLKDYLIVSVHYFLTEAGYYTGDDGGEGEYRFEFTAQDAQVPYRAPMVTRRPKTSGPQTAVVTGPAGAEVYTDDYQRIKVHFRWDRYGQYDENSSCWIRVSNDSAGSGFGSIMAPRVGQEVIVDFIGGNPDRPVVTGRVYNDKQQPAFTPSPTQSGFISRSFGGGSAANANHLIFDDAAGNEHVHLHAERNYTNSVELSTLETVGVDHHHTVGNNHVINVGENSNLNVGTDYTIDVGSNLTTTVGEHESHTVGETQTVEVGAAAVHNYKATLNKTVTEAATYTYEDTLTTTVTGIVTDTFNSNVDQTITGDVTRTITGEVTDTITGNTTHTHDGTYTQHITGAVTTKHDSYTFKMYDAPVTSQYTAFMFDLAPVAKMTIGGSDTKVFANINNFFGLKFEWIGIEKKFVGSISKIKAAKLEAAAKAQEYQMIKAKANVAVRSIIGMKQSQKGMQTEMTGLKKQVAGLDSRVNGLTSIG